ncbi:FRG domain-containing protein [Bisgaard Taxon 46]
MEITTIAELIKLLEKIGDAPKGYTRFFRGHSNQEYELNPSIYRNNGFIKNEHNIIKDVIMNNPESFSENDSAFTILSKLQHYSYPTRLLDLTTNVLVALYFIVNNSSNDGELIIFDIPNTDIKYFDSDTVSILSSISLMESSFDIERYKQIENINFKIEKIRLIIEQYNLPQKNQSLYKDIEDIFKNANFHKNHLNENPNAVIINFLFKEAFKLIPKLIDELDICGLEEQKIDNKAYIKSNEYFNSQTNILKLLHEIRKEKPSFRPIIKTNDLERVICVKGKLDNNRIIRQQGCFLLFGIKDKKEVQAKLNSSWKKNI